MPSIVDAIYSGGYPLLYLPMHDVGGRVAKLAGCEYSGTPVATDIGSASPSNFTESVADFNGASSVIELPNFGNHMTGETLISALAIVEFHAIPSGFKRIFRITKNTSTMLNMAQSAASISFGGRNINGTSGSFPNVNAATINIPLVITGTIAFHAKSTFVRIGASSHHSVGFAFSTRDWENLDGISLYVGNDGFGVGFVDCTLHSLAMWRNVVPSELQHLDFVAATTLGEWCNVDLVGGQFIVGGVVANGTYNYTLHKGGPDGVLMAKGSDFVVTAGASTHEFYVPEAGTNYWLTLNDSGSSTIGRGQQVTLTAVP